MPIIDTTPRLDGGLPTAREREGFYQFKVNGPFYRLRSFLFGPSGDADQAKFNEHRFDGRNRPDSFVMVGLDSLWSGAFSPYYSELPVIHRNLFGAPVSSDLINASYAVDAAGTRRREVFYLSPTGGNQRRTWNAQFGEILYGRWKIRSYSADVARNGDGGAFSGNITAHANDILSYANALPGLVAQNAKFQVVATAVTGNLVTGYRLQGTSIVRQVTHVPGDTAIQTKAKYEAFGDGVTVNVVGTIAAAGNVNKIPQGTTGQAQFAQPNSTAVINLANAFDGNLATYATFDENGKQITVSFTTPQVINEVYFKILVRGGALKIQGSNDGGTTWTDIYSNLAFPGNSVQTITAASLSSTAFSLFRMGGNGFDLYELELRGTGPGGGTQTIEFASPANSNVSLTKVSGDAGYVVAQTVAGSDGNGAPFVPDSPPVESKNVIIYMASSWEQLAAIDPDNEDAPEILLGVLGHTWSSGDNANAVWTENRRVAPSNWVSLGNEVSFGITVWKGPLSEAMRVLQDGCTVGKQYFRIAYRCDVWQWWLDGKYSRNAVQDKGNDNELPTRTTPFMLMDDRISSLRTTIIGPATEYFTGE